MVELLIVMAVAGILLLATVPSFVSLFVRMRIEGTGNELSADLQNARSEAIRRRAAVVLASNANGAGYTDRQRRDDAQEGDVHARHLDHAVDQCQLRLDARDGQCRGAHADGSGATSQLRVKTNVMGRVEMCSPSQTITGYPAC